MRGKKYGLQTRRRLCPVWQYGFAKQIGFQIQHFLRGRNWALFEALERIGAGKLIGNLSIIVMKILYLARDEGTEIRGVKTCNSLVKLGHQVVFVGWDRIPGKKKDLTFLPEVKVRVLVREGVFAKNSFEGWGAYYRHIIRSLYEERPDAVHAVNEDKTVLVLPFKGILYRR